MRPLLFTLPRHAVDDGSRGTKTPLLMLMLQTGTGLIDSDGGRMPRRPIGVPPTHLIRGSGGVGGVAAVVAEKGEQRRLAGSGCGDCQLQIRAGGAAARGQGVPTSPATVQRSYWGRRQARRAAARELSCDRG